METRTRLEELVFEFLETPEADQEEHLEQACREHPELADELRTRIASLVRYGFGSQDSEVENLLEPGKVVGDYRLLRLLGSGGMGLVWEATQISLGDRRVALKFIRPEYLLFPKAKQRFKREALLSSRLSHSGICSVYEIGEYQKTPFLAMQFIEGDSLADKIDLARKSNSNEPLLLAKKTGSGSSTGAIASALDLFEKAAIALHAAHEAGVLHRDIKPGNLMITKEGDPILLDFGLAKGEDDEGPQLTVTGDTLGTLSYMAPEQITGRSHLADRRADVYSLGASLYETITLHRPFEASNRNELHRKIVDDALPEPRRHNPSIPKDLVTVLECALSKKPEDRYDSALALALELGRVRRHEPILAERKSTLARVGLWTQRNPLVASLLGLLSTGFTTALVLLYLLVLENAENSSGSLVGQSLLAQDTAPEVALELAVSAVHASATAASEQRLYDAMRAYRELAVVELDGVGHSVEAYEGGFIATTFRGSLYNIDATGKVRSRCRIEDSVRGLILWPDAEPLAHIITEKGDLYCWNGTDPEPTPLDLGISGWVFGCNSRDGSRMLLGGTECAVVIDRKSRAIIRRVTTEAGFTAGAFTFDSSRIVLGDDAGVLRMCIVESKKTSILFRAPKAVAFHRIAHMPLAGEGGVVVAISRRVKNKVLTIDIASTKWEFIEGNIGIMQDLVAAPERYFLVTAADTGELAIWLAESKIRLRSTAIGHKGDVMTLEYSPSGRLFASGSVDGTVRLWDSRGVQRARLVGHGQDVHSIAFAPDESILASVGLDRSLRIWSVDEPKPAFAHPWDAVSYFAAVTSDGQSAYVMCTDSVVWRHDLDGESFRFGGPEYRGGGGGWVALDEQNDLLVRARTINARQTYSELVVWDQISTRPKLVSRKGRIFSKISRVIFFEDHKRLLLILKGSTAMPPGFQIWALDGHELTEVSKHVTAETNLSKGLNAGLILPGEKSIALGCKDGTISIVDLEGKVLETLVHRVGIPVRCLASTSDGRLIACAGRDGWMSIFERSPDGYLRVRQWKAHSSRVWSLRKTEAGLLTASGDGRVCLWSLGGELLREFRYPDVEFHDAWIPKGKNFIIVVSSDASIRRLYLDIADAISRAERMLDPGH